MASIYDPRFRALDANAEPVSGAGMWVFDTGTTTPSDIFTDEGLTTPASNPLTSDANGYFPQFFIASQSVVDIQVRQTTTITSTLLWSATDIDSLGAEDASTLVKDFGANGRFQVRGASTVVQVEVGDPDGDDVGGTGRIGGWNGTQADEIEIDAAQTNVTGDLDVAGDFTVDGTGPFNKVIDSGTETASGTVDIALPTGYDGYELEIYDVVGSTSITLSVRFAYDDVPTFKSGGTDYAWQFETQVSSTVSGGVDTEDDKITLGSVVVSPSNVPNHILATIITGASRETQITGEMVMWGSTYGKTTTWFGGVTKEKGYGKATYIRFLTQAGTIAFKYVLRGIRNL